MGDNLGVKDCLEAIEHDVMEGLTPFQRATVEHIAEIYAGDQKRVLVADEVGLGKTLIARGVIAKIARLREEEGDDLVKVAYVCSNASIAAQNISKLAIDGSVELARADESRLSMQHLQIARERGDEQLRARYIQITPLTPGTSFSINAGPGTMHERALMLAVLTYDPRFCKDSSRYQRLSDLLWAKRSNSKPGNWEWWRWRTEEDVKEARADDPDCGERLGYPYDVLEGVGRELGSSGSTTFSSLCSYLDAGECVPSRERLIINDLRRAFSKVSVDLLRPDFVIMDEFQRFRSLISDDDSESSLLAKRFLGGDTRVLLLSATPFRLYSTEAELDTGGFGDSYHEFLEVMDFLGEQDATAHEEFRRAWGDYVISLKRLGAGVCDVVSISETKKVAEGFAQNYLARTERQSTGELGPIFDNSKHVRRIDISPDDVKAFVRMRNLLGDAGIRRGLMNTDFVKSCPYPLSFMSGYKLFKELEEAAAKKPSLVSANKRADGGMLWLRKWNISSYEKLQVHNARFQALMEDVTNEAMRPERLLWVPASRPYYRPNSTSPYANTQGFSKMILFSSWAMVPPSLSCLLSYEFERKNVQKLKRSNGKQYRYFKDEEDRGDEGRDSQALPYRRMRFDRDQHNAFLLVYPSRYLAGLIDIAELASSEDVTLAELRRRVRRRIAEDLRAAFGLEKLPERGGQRSSVDSYIKVALRLDECFGHDVLGELLGEEGFRGLRFDACYKTEVQVLRRIYDESKDWSLEDFRRMPSDLLDVLTDAAIASPAVCALRTYGVYAEYVPAWMGFQFGHAFAKRMNTSSATLTVAAVMEHKDEASSHWKNLLDYACEGNLQAVLDEYAYLQRPVGVSLDGRGTILYIHRGMVGPGDEPDLRNVEAVHGVRTPTVAGTHKRIDSMRMRTNIAAAFMDVKKSTSDKVISRTNLREAFNSPFRPFVLVSTSVGQEGLDFHRYCRKVCHWNLPSNPIDLEQREGRVNRYQGLSVRQSIAARYGAMEFKDGGIWKQLFETAESEELGNGGGEPSSGLLPNWGVTKGDVLLPVERYAYLYPFSKDVDQYEALIKQVYHYRMVIGQPDQEETLRLLHERVEEGKLDESELTELYINLCPFVRDAEAQGDAEPERSSLSWHG